MNSLVAWVLVAVCVGDVLSSQYHGPIATPVVLQNGYLADTHEVAAARTAHLAQLAKESHGYGYSQGYGHGYSHDNHDYSRQYATGYGGYHGYSHHAAPYHGPLAKPVVLHTGYLADTHEVAAAKANHHAAVAKAKAYGGYGHDYSGQYATGYDGYHGYSHHVAPYHGPLAKPVILHNGYLADTHEVAAAKSEHYAAVAKANAHGRYEHDYSY